MININDDLIKQLNKELIEKILEMREMFLDSIKPSDTVYQEWIEELTIQSSLNSKVQNEFMTIISKFSEDLKKVLNPEGEAHLELVTEKDVYEKVPAGCPIFTPEQIGQHKYYVKNKTNLEQDYRLAVQKLIKRSLTYKEPNIRPHDAIPGNADRMIKFLAKNEPVAKFLRENIKKLEPINVAFLKFREKKRSINNKPTEQELKTLKDNASKNLETARLGLYITKARLTLAAKAKDEFANNYVQHLLFSEISTFKNIQSMSEELNNFKLELNETDSYYQDDSQEEYSNQEIIKASTKKLPDESESSNSILLEEETNQTNENENSDSSSDSDNDDERGSSDESDNEIGSSSDESGSDSDEEDVKIERKLFIKTVYYFIKKVEKIYTKLHKLQNNGHKLDNFINSTLQEFENVKKQVTQDLNVLEKLKMQFIDPQNPNYVAAILLLKNCKSNYKEWKLYLKTLKEEPENETSKSKTKLYY